VKTTAIAEYDITLDRESWEAFKAAITTPRRPVYEVHITGLCTLLAHAEQRDERTFDVYPAWCEHGITPACVGRLRVAVVTVDDRGAPMAAGRCEEGLAFARVSRAMPSRLLVVPLPDTDPKGGPS